MAGNSKRQGAIRNTESKKSRAVGSGGQRRRGLEGKGPTPKAADRVGHVNRKRPDSVKSRSRGGRRSEREGELIAGRNPVLEALEAGVPARELILQRGTDSDKRLKQIVTSATRLRLRTREVNREDLTELAGGIVHQGVALVIDDYTYADMQELLIRTNPANPGLLVMLDGVTDPRNLGAIARSAAAFGGTGLVIPGRRSVQVNAAAWRTSAGALAHIPVSQVTNLVREIGNAKKAGFTVVGLAGESKTTISEIAFESDPVMLVVGGEADGIGRLVGESCDFLASIPISRRIESLNVSVAAGIALYEVARSRR